ncbi:hypothetical protein G7Y89_g3742 [Cudoniella acicularis]|uniref:Uncharacterized protein n=1 Tax=Cudoniella acicularis TaxID=354080 RepID=A0A8H4W5B7_9HELO|nr:hypothetical protein G7Y89_g3742 [Cudoniella acicularis]
MDWARDNAGVNDKDLDAVFKYEEKQTTVVRMLVGMKVQIRYSRENPSTDSFQEPEISSLQGKSEWDNWIYKARTASLYPEWGDLETAKRTGELPFGGVKKVQSNDWLDRLNAEMPGRSTTQRSLTLASLIEKGPTGNQNSSGRRSVRTLPFSKDVFRLITRKFYTHSSISRDISRADIPVFSSAEVQMGEPEGPTYPAYVYNCRTTNAWEMDLALTATYFPHCDLTFAIVFGCPLSLEEEIIKRLTLATAEAAHPLLMPGIFAEIERSRHIHIVEATIDELETRIFELDNPDSEAEKRNQEKRSAWLDTTYLRNALVSWNTQLAKMSAHTNELNTTVFKPSTSEEAITAPRDKSKNHKLDTPAGDNKSTSLFLNKQYELPDPSCYERGELGRNGKYLEGQTLREEPFQEMGDGKDLRALQEYESIIPQRDPEVVKHQMRRIGDKIKNRIQTVSDEYDEKIRDCTMRVDGMAMATQWAHGETNVEIALSTSRESKHMRSIAIVTMVFLPGTFFASVFSMTFFNWSNSEGSVVSKHVWIYVVVTVFFTLLTIGSWCLLKKGWSHGKFKQNTLSIQSSISSAGMTTGDDAITIGYKATDPEKSE